MITKQALKTAFKKDGPRAVRVELGENQVEFWGRMSCTQSAGSRYETGRPMNGPLRVLFGVVYLGEKAPIRVT